MFRKRFIALLLVPCGALLIAFGARHTPAASVHQVTFTQSVAPIFYNHCAACHHVGGLGPMPLVTYTQAKPFSALIRDRVVKGIMPPWFADAPRGEFSNDSRLTEAEIHTIAAWVDEGSPEGNPKYLPPQPKFDGRWVYGKPDAVFSMPETATIPAHGDGVYMHFRIPTHFKEKKWIQAFQVLPSNPRVVHHSTVDMFLPTTATQGKKKNGKSPWSKYMYKAGTMEFVRADAPVINNGCGSPWGGEFPGVKNQWQGEGSGPDLGDLGVYLPGRPAERLPAGFAWPIPAGAVIHLTMHYMPMGKIEHDRSQVGFWFAKGPIKERVDRLLIPNMLFKMPAGDANFTDTSCYTFPVAVDVLSYTIHMHYRGKSATVYAIYPNGKKEILLSVPHYNFDWQLKYVLSHSKYIPKGTVIKTVYHDDNSRANPLNPDPTKTIRWGDPSTREMQLTIMEFIVANKKAPALSARR